MNGDFWSRRRAAVAEEALAEEHKAVAAEAAAAEAALAERDDAEILSELDLPEPEALGSAEEVRTFLSSAVPQRLKTRALRRLWRINPALANLDGLIDYGEDFTDSATVVENLQTAYQVGKGMLAHIEALAAEAETAAAPEADEQTDRDPGNETDEIAPDAGPPVIAAVSPDPMPEAVPETMPDTEHTAPVRRRMTFTFDTAT